MFEKVKRFAKKIATSKKTQMTCLMMVCGVTALMAQTTAGDYSAGTAALTQVSEEIAKYVPIVVKLCYAIAGVVAVVGAISVYIAMNNEEQDVKKIIMYLKAYKNKVVKSDIKESVYNCIIICYNGFCWLLLFSFV